MTATRYVCIHGHFYQPPRENPWLEAIEAQDTAYPYHDWNQRITEECYEPNAASRILGADKRITRINNNYARMSFNFGPTLLSWLEHESPTLYGWLLQADQRSQERFGGHGSAMAQPYNHMILPLANRRDKITQIRWGVRDFQHRFGRNPEGMWLPETAVDLESLDLMVEQGIRFTVLAPRQGKRVRAEGAKHWRDVEGAEVDPSRPYWVNLPSGNRIAVFFYDGDIAQEVAFDGLLRDGEAFADRLLGAFPDDAGDDDEARLVHIATDGETYGHHHRHGDMALAYVLHNIEQQSDVELTNYAQFLEQHPPVHEAEIFENSSWSCVHGVERWRSDCGCHSGMHPEWHQAWRKPLREALDWLRDTVAPLYAETVGASLLDPWAARDAYIDVVLNRDEANLDRFLAAHAPRKLDDAERERVWKLLELQRHAMLMYTSCGWFFDDLSGIETVQVIQYAARAVQLGEELFRLDPEPRFVELLANAPSNVPAHGDGARVYDKLVRPAKVDLAKVGAHYAINSIFEGRGTSQTVYCYEVECVDHHQHTFGQSTVAMGHAEITSRVTRESQHLTYGVLHFGDHNLSAGVRPYRDDETYQALIDTVSEAFDAGDVAEALRRLDAEFNQLTYSLQSLFRDEQRRVVGHILDATFRQVDAAYRQIYEQHVNLMQFITNIGMPLPHAFATAAAYVLNAELREMFRSDDWDHDRIHEILGQAERWDVSLDAEGLEHALEGTVERFAGRFAQAPEEREHLDKLENALALAADLPFEIDPWRVQNTYYELARRLVPEYADQAAEGDEEAAEWLASFRELGNYLGIDVDAVVHG